MRFYKKLLDELVEEAAKAYHAQPAGKKEIPAAVYEVMSKRQFARGEFGPYFREVCRCLGSRGGKRTATLRQQPVLPFDAT